MTLLVGSKLAEMIEKFQKICGNVYNIQEALQRQNLKQEDVERLREKLKSCGGVPKFLVDNQV